MASCKIGLVEQAIPICNFPSKPTCLAYDSDTKKFAVGCDNGNIIILDEQQHHVLHRPFQTTGHGSKVKDELLLSFGIGKDVLLAFYKSKGFFWTPPYTNKPTQLLLNEVPTVLVWSSVYSTYFVGTTAGTVYQVFVSDNKMSSDECTKSILRGVGVHGKVVAIVEEPGTREDKGTHNVLVVYSSGLCVVWNRHQGHRSQSSINDKGTSEVSVPLYAWWPTSADAFNIACTNGFVWTIHYENKNNVFTQKKKSNFLCRNESCKDVSPISKFQLVPSSASPLLVYMGGCPNLPADSIDCNVLSKFSMFRTTEYYVLTVNVKECLPLVPFGGRIVDILYLRPSAEQDLSVLAVLTESELVLLNMSTQPQEIKNASGTMLCYPRLSPVLHITPPVTCLQHCGVCSQEFLASIQAQEEYSSELIVTGHEDGSVRLWLCFRDKRNKFKLALAVYTAEYFDIKESNEVQVSLVTVTNDQQHLLVENKSCHVLLFKLCPSTTATEMMKPQSQEVVLKQEQDDTPLANPLPTPLPHLRSCQWQTHVQLLQHFICYYQSGRSKELNPVPVNCVEYDKELALLAVGTNKGLIILDTLTNMLIQVIGSEKKLLDLSGFGTGSNVSVASRSECRVVKLCTAMICSTVSQQDAQLKCWVGTAGGSLGVFTVTRRNVGEPLQLEKTGEGQQKNSAITSIQLLGQSSATHGADTSRSGPSDAQAFLDGENITPTEYLVMTTEKNCYIDCVKKPVIKDTSINTILISWIGIIMDQPYLICLLKYGKVDIYALPDVTKLDAKNTEFDTKSMLYSSTGDFAMLQLFQREKLKLTTFKHLVASEV